jgi:hypothetical protein
MNQPSLLDWQPPEEHKFLGSTITEADSARLRGQLKRVHDVMQDRKVRTLRQLADDAQCPEASASARFRDLRRLGYPVCDKNLGNGLWHYWWGGQ